MVQIKKRTVEHFHHFGLFRVKTSVMRGIPHIYDFYNLSNMDTIRSIELNASVNIAFMCI